MPDRCRIFRRAWLPVAVIAAALELCACAAGPTVAGSAIPPVPAGQARIWFYRDFEPSVSLNVANVSLNGVDGIPVGADGGGSYRDVPPGPYHITVESVGKDVNQAKDLGLSAGQEAFVKILSLSSWEGGGDLNAYRRDTFYVSLVPPDQARATLASRPFRGKV